MIVVVDAKTSGHFRCLSENISPSCENAEVYFLLVALSSENVAFVHNFWMTSHSYKEHFK